MEETLRTYVKDERNPSESGIDDASKWLRSEDRKGIWILAPETLALDQDSGATILGWDYYDKKPRGYRYVTTDGVVIATRVESRETFASTIREPKEPGDAGNKANRPPIAEGKNLLTFRVDLRSRLHELPWRAGTYIVDVALDGQTSNRLKFTLTPGKAVERDPAIATFIEEQRMNQGQEFEFRPSLAELASYSEINPKHSAPAVPSTEGIALSVDRVSVYKPEAHNILRGSFRLSIPASFYLSEITESQAATTPTAVVPITLIITGNDLSGPSVVPLHVPAYSKIDRASTASVVTGNFAVDLFALDETAQVVQTYTIWAYSGAIRSQPAQNAIITPDMLH